MKEYTVAWRSTFASLGNPDFRLLWLGLLFMMGALQMKEMVVGYLVYDLTSSPFILALVEAGMGLSILVFGLLGGVVADRMERKFLIQGGQFATAISALVIAVAITTNSITWVHLLIAAMFEGVCFAFLVPARHAMIAQIVGPNRITNGLALTAAGMSVSALIVPAIAGTLYFTLGPGKVYFIITGMRIIAYFLISSLPRIKKTSVKSHNSILSEIKDGLYHILQNRLLLTLILIGLMQPLLAVPFRVLIPVFVVDIYQQGPESMGLLLSMIGVGALIGSLFIASVDKGHRGLILIMGGFLIGGALLLTSLIPIYLAALGIVLMIGLGENGHRALNQSLVIEQVHDRYRGRTISVFLMTYGLTPLGVLPAGLIAQFYGVQTAVGILAGLMLVISSIVFLTQNRLRELA